MRTPPRNPRYEFHVSRDARDRCRFPEALFSTDGRAVFANTAAARRFAARLTQARGGTPVASPAELYAMGLLDEILHLVLARYRDQADPRAWLDALEWYAERLGAETQDRTLLEFVAQFPPVAVYRGDTSGAAWLGETRGDTPHRAVALEEMLLLWVTNGNPACREYAELFDDAPLKAASAYGSVSGGFQAYFATRPKFGPARENLVDFLLAPLRAAPHSLRAQLDWIRQNWGWLLGDLLEKLLAAADALAEEERGLWMRMHGAGAGMTVGDSSAGAVPRYGAGDAEYEAFSPDAVWMPEVVMIAKSTYVWLDQLARTYGREVRRLDQVPDEELDRLASFGLTALWLIGLWERSPASATIKHRTGNPDAMASAYSLYDYVIAGELGGEPAWRALRDRAAARGIRLASDMVPNHMGLDSRWVIEHPDWFLQLDHAPYPAYRWDGPDLSSDPGVEIRIEDHYWDRSDAAVVFRRVDRASGDTRFLYHGNDGTSFPWNDTAQLDYLRADVREQVIQTILAVARQFPIIRFDAAMTLAKRHIQRLWFPEPGSGGGIPSRAGHGVTKAQFDAALPVEFWREVVDRVAHEAPGTLLLAEAFWMMEGYFVRTLGMHRVYNSAFMNMLRDEQNANYRSVIKNTLEFDPDILQRYVNFVNNPDERTAVEQFGRGEKYFGVAVLMSTLPGLPMFGHGQFEGFEEKYGMEYRRARLDEPVDAGLEAEHRRRIAPLLRRRPLFASARRFLMYDAWLDGGGVNEDVYAYSNTLAGASGLVVFHNRWAETRVWLRSSVAFADKSQGRALRQRTLAEGLELPAGDRLVRCRELVREQEHLFPVAQLREQGLPIALAGYESRVYLDWREQPEDGRPWRRLAAQLGGEGVRDLDEALRRMELEPVHAAVAELLAPAMDTPAGRDALAHVAGRLFAAARVAVPGAWRGDPGLAAGRLAERFAALDGLPALAASARRAWPEAARAVLPVSDAPCAHAAARAWAVTEALAVLRDPERPDASAAPLFDALQLRAAIATALHARGCDAEEGWRHAARVRAAFAHRRADDARPASDGGASPRARWLADPDVRWLLDVHEQEGVTWFRRERLEQLLWFMALAEWLALAAEFDATAARALYGRLDRGIKTAEASGWKWEPYLAAPAAASRAGRTANVKIAGKAAPKRVAAAKKKAAGKVAPQAVRKTAEKKALANPGSGAKKKVAGSKKKAATRKAAKKKTAPRGVTKKKAAKKSARRSR